MGYQMFGLGLPPGANTTPPWCGGIRPLQTMLSDLGLYSGLIDGKAGTGTNNAIVAAQKQLGVATGAVGKPFCQALTAAWTAKMAVPADVQSPAAPPPNGEASFNPSGGDITPTDPSGAMVSGGLMDKWAGLSTPAKAGVVGGGLLLLGGLGYGIYAATR